MDGPKKNNRGSRFFLPKIEYARLENTSKWTAEGNETNLGNDFNRSTGDESNIGEKHQNKRTVGLGKQSNDRPSATFTKFSVLPPIQDHGTTRGKYYKHLDKTLTDEKVDDSEIDFRRRGSFLRRQHALFCGERGDGAARINTGHLQIVGQSYLGNQFQPSILVKRESEPLIARRPSSTPQPVSTLAGSNRGSSDNRRTDDDLHRTKRFSKFKRFNSESSQDNNPIYRNATSLDTSNAKASLLSPSDIKRKISLSLDNPQSRPVSRCHIDINVNETETQREPIAKESDELSSLTNNNNDDAVEFDSNRSISAPIVQISSDNTNKDVKPPSIQILIDTLESAKNEIPEKLELPKMSVREQRRRSALCRVNSKQVDDFLLVHNLKDLGLL